MQLLQLGIPGGKQSQGCLPDSALWQTPAGMGQEGGPSVEHETKLQSLTRELGGSVGALVWCWKSAVAFEEMNEEGLQVGACPEQRLMSQ